MSEYDNIKEALAELGETWVDVGRKLVELDCKGHREEGYDCPVFHYLTDIKCIERVERVVSDEVWISDEPLDEPGTEPEARVALGSAVLQFVRSFDEGEWPQLERH